jgi:hypothetical protein
VFLDLVSGGTNQPGEFLPVWEDILLPTMCAFARGAS